MIFLGILYNTKTMTIELTHERREELTDLVHSWADKTAATLKEVQSLLGKLSFACSTVRSGRVFLARIINFIKDFHAQNMPETLPVPVTVTEDVWWWSRFMNTFDGKTMMPDVNWKAPDVKITTDSCLSACGGWAQGDYFHIQYPKELITDPSIAINELECVAIVVALKIWAPKLKGLNLLLHCDNKSTVDVINHGHASNKFTQKCLREIVWICAQNNMWIKVKFIPGVTNRYADLLSRLHLSSWYYNTFMHETEGLRKNHVRISTDIFNFLNNW